MRGLVEWAPALVAVLMPALVSAQDRFFDSNGVRIRYVDQGSGQPVVLVHGFSGNIETGWINSGSAAFAADVRGRHAQAVTDAELTAVRVPTLAIVGTLDAALASVHELKKILPSLNVVVINGATHAGERGVPGRPEFVNAIREFIAVNQQKSAR